MINRSVLSLAIFQLLVILPGITKGQSDFAGKRPSGPDSWEEVKEVTAEFQDALIQGLEYRERIRNGAFSYTLTIYNKDLEKVVHRQMGKFAFNYDTEQFCHFVEADRKKVLTDSKTQELKVAEQFGSYRTAAVSTQGQLVQFGPNKIIPAKIQAEASKITTPLLIPFEFRSFGIAFFGEYSSGTDHIELTGNYLKWHKILEMKNPKGEVTWRFSAIDLKIARDEGFWITENTFRSKTPGGKSSVRNWINTASKLEIEKFNGLFVPSKVVYSNPQERHSIEIEWESLNSPLDEKLFQMDRALSFQSEAVLKGDDK